MSATCQNQEITTTTTCKDTQSAQPADSFEDSSLRAEDCDTSENTRDKSFSNVQAVS